MTHVNICRKGGVVNTQLASPFEVSVARSLDISDPCNQIMIASFKIGAFGAKAHVAIVDDKDAIAEAVAALLAVAVEHAAEIRDAMKEVKI